MTPIRAHVERRLLHKSRTQSNVITYSSDVMSIFEPMTLLLLCVISSSALAAPLAYVGVDRNFSLQRSPPCGGEYQVGWQIKKNGLVVAPGGGCVSLARPDRRTLQIIPCDDSDKSQQFEFTQNGTTARLSR